MNPLTEALRGAALVLLWIPIKLIRFFAAIAVFSPLIMGINATNLTVSLAAGLISISVLKLHRWLRGPV